MADIIKSQADFFRNIPLINRDYVASVHLENAEDKTFCDATLQRYNPGKYFYISASRSPKGKQTSGCEQCLKFRDYLSSKFFIYVDSDMRYIMQEDVFDATHFICQTYTYSWENHYCESKNLQKRFEEVCNEYSETFSFKIFLKELSSVLYTPFLLLLHCMQNNSNEFNLQKFNACMPGQCRREELTNNGLPLIEKIRENFDAYLKSEFMEGIDLCIEEEQLRVWGITESNVYLHVRGHNLFNLTAYIGSLLCRGLGLSFKKDVLMKDIPAEDYWELQNIGNDIRAIADFP